MVILSRNHSFVLSKTKTYLCLTLKPFKSSHCIFARDSKLSPGTFSNQFDNKFVRRVHHDFRNVMDKAETIRSSIFIRNLLYPDTDDEVINELKICDTVQDVFKIVESNETLNQQHINQAILVLRDLQKLDSLQTMFSLPVGEDGPSIYKLNELPFFQKLLNLMETNVDKMKIDELSCALLYLSKLNVSNQQPVIKKLTDACEREFMHASEENTLLADFARFFMTIKDWDNIWSLYTMNTYIPFLMNSLDTCQNYDDFRHITICLQKCVPLLTNYHLNKYIEKIDMLLPESTTDLGEDYRIRTILKVVNFLNFKYWNGRYIREVKSLFGAMKGKLNRLSFQEISLLHKIAFPLQEPLYLLREIEQVTRSWASTSESILPLSVFQISFPGTNLQSDDDLKTQIKEYLREATCHAERMSSFSNIYFLLFNTNLRFDKDLANAYWSAMVNSMKSSNANETMDNISWIIHKYVYFICAKNTNRHEHLERSITSEIAPLLYNEHKFNYCPSSFTKVALGILAFHKNPFHVFTEHVWQKLLDFIPRLSIHENVFVCSILRVAANRFKKRRRNLAIFLRYYVHLISATNANTMNILRLDENITLEKLNTLMFTHALTEGIKTTEIFNEICERLKRVTIEELYSKIIRDGIYNFTVCNHVIPEFTDLSVEYCVRERDTINGHTIATVLNFCYMFAFVPKHLSEFLNVAASLIERDRDYLGSSLYLRTAAALSYFGELPSSWSDHIFNVNFLEQLDVQCNKLNFKTAGFLKKELMELNRILCIDYPSRDIPWFHKKYCQEQITLERSKPNTFHSSVLQTLEKLVNVKEAIDTHCSSPYGHKIDILLYLNKHGQPTNPRICDPAELHKVAIVLRRGSSYPYFNGKGKLELFTRQLEMLNYKAVLINKQQWDSMYMSELAVKMDHLRELIWAS